MPGLRINHVSVSSPDQDESARFYTDLFGAERIPAPNFGFRVDWFRFGDTQLHIFPRGRQGAASDITSASRSTTSSRSTGGPRSSASSTRSFTDWVRVLEDGNVQFYLRDPGGNLVEINGPVGDYTTDDIPELKPLTELYPPGARERRRPALPVNSLLEAR